MKCFDCEFLHYDQTFQNSSPFCKYASKNLEEKRLEYACRFYKEDTSYRTCDKCNFCHRLDDISTYCVLNPELSFCKKGGCSAFVGGKQ